MSLPAKATLAPARMRAKTLACVCVARKLSCPGAHVLVRSLEDAFFLSVSSGSWERFDELRHRFEDHYR